MDLKIALAQYPISYFQDKSAWRQHTSDWVESAAKQGAQLLVFPEYGSMELVSIFPKSIQVDLNGQLEALQELLEYFLGTYRILAEQYNCTIVAPSFPVKIGDVFINRTYVISSRNEGFQDKWFMTRFERESWGISSAPKELSIFETAWGNFGVQICYDIEFPLGAHLLSSESVQLIVAPSCTETLRGATRVHIGARSRALEQQVYVAVSQTVLNADWSPAVDVNYGYSAVYSSPDLHLPETGILSEGQHNTDGWHFQSLDFSLNEKLQTEGQVFNRKDMSRIEMSISEKVSIRKVKL